MSQVVLTARSRTNLGSAESRRLRRSGRVPGVVYGRSGTAVSIDLDTREFVNGVKNISASTIVKVIVEGKESVDGKEPIEGKSFDAFVKATQRNITNGAVIHVDFYEVESGVLLRAKVSLHVSGNPVGVREGGVLEIPLHEIEVECFPKDLPERISVDISELRANQSMHVRDLQLAEGVKVVSGLDQVIALVKYTKEEAASAEAVPGAPAAAAAASAEGKAKA
ncbi:50S ribosomal protein L25 [Breznakiellaceae bacterium SP9]